MSADGKLAREFAVTQDLDPANRSIRKAGIAQGRFVYASTVFEPVQCLEIDRYVTDCMAGIVEPAFRNTANERHLTAFETDTDRTARASGLAFAAAAAGFAVTA